MSGGWTDYFDKIEYILCCPLVESVNGIEKSLGAATYLMPGIFLTAKHVISDGWKIRNDDAVRDGSYNPDRPDYSEDATLKILHRLKDGKLAVWNVNKASDIPGLDVSILICESWGQGMQEFSKKALSPVTVDLHVPEVGQLVNAFGYPSTQTILDPVRGYHHHVNLRRAQGEIEEVYLTGAGLVKTPCFQINAEIEGGMSGGPVFNSAGELCGIISTAIDPTDEEPFYTAFVSLLWQAFTANMVSTIWGNEDIQNLLQSSEKGLITIRGARHFTQKADGTYEWNSVSTLCTEC